MPIYEFRCRNCGEEFEELVRMGTKEEEVECPHCGKYECEKLLSTFMTSGGGSSSSGGSSVSGSSGSSGFS